ncbi:MAG TPA: Wzz/FepE/Etk N-terminal domain-containing protein, partial [Actinomycetota bacterium]|nr:Wzz/FepE/Etk N-terminal domain-containing protein [Actinomycetota bacterium]
MSRSATPRDDYAGSGQGVTLGDYIARLNSGRRLIAALTVLAALLAFLLSAFQTELYRAKAKVLVKPLPLVPATEVASVPVLNLSTEVQFMTSRTVLGDALRSAGSDDSFDTFLAGLNVITETDTEVLVITYESESPEQAAENANAIATSYLAAREEDAEEELAVIA